MNTIYDNTFVLGQTSATNFIAGNGITIDSPSAGTVRIGNDETVLWSGTCSSGQSLTASESVSAFDYYRIYLRNTERQQQTIVDKFVNTANNGNLNKWVTLDCFQAGGVNGEFFTINCGKCEWDNSYKVLTYNGGYAAWVDHSMAWHQITSTGSMPVIQKIVGINRIGGNA